MAAALTATTKRAGVAGTTRANGGMPMALARKQQIAADTPVTREPPLCVLRRPAVEPAKAMDRLLADRAKRIAIAAYLRAERRGFAPGHELDDWLAAEREIDATDAGIGAE